eukprot:TRINITY_DN160_c2_g2_i1.p1 TRINITY_DN160_c2_g2~~TRINITY_DN160_c2_g2_i1.p1  ORF type:complete len:357 (+),score=95.33 TRINITY_DN160_c2_g2_i1:43-1071(+)
MSAMLTLMMAGCATSIMGNNTLNEMEKLLSMPRSDLAKLLRESPLAAIAPTFDDDTVFGGKAGTLPTVLAHGMGDSCFNPGMRSITRAVSKHLGTYAVCPKIGDTWEEDEIDGFLMTMNENVDIFAQKVRADPQLQGGFNAIGLSQGNSIIRGYIQKYNDPPVSTFLSIHGTVQGVSGFPRCRPDGKYLGGLCRLFDGLLGDGAYFEYFQNHLFQADFYRDPNRVGKYLYKKNSQLGDWNQEGRKVHPEYKENFGKTKRFAMIKAEKDTMVFPNEGEWWGHFQDGSRKVVLTMRETSAYKQDTYGLQTADKAGKIIFNSTARNHLQFTKEQLLWWTSNYFLQ